MSCEGSDRDLGVKGSKLCASSERDRLDELASMLAAGYLRLLSRRRNPSRSNDLSAVPLDFPGDQSVCVEPLATGETP